MRDCAPAAHARRNALFLFRETRFLCRAGQPACPTLTLRDRRAHDAGGRVFGLGGISGGTLVNTVGGQLNFGYDLNGNAVTNYAQWQAAVAQLRTPAGRDYNNTYKLANPALYYQIEQTLATTDTSAPSEEIDGNVNATLAALASLGIVPLVVTQVSCASFDFTTDSPSVPAYWGERWELYKRACHA